MKLNLHILHIFSILMIYPSLINTQLKGQNRSLQSCNFATLLVETGKSILYIQQVLGYRIIKTTMINTHKTNKAMNGKQSTFDRLNLNEEKLELMKK